MRRLALILAIALLGVGCTEPLTDTGFVGTWSRNGKGSEVHIGRENDALVMCVENLPLGHAQRTKCTSPSRSVVYQGVEESYAYEYLIRPGENEREILVEISGAPIGDRPGTPLHWIDRMRLEPDGLAFTLHTVERNGEALDPQPGPYNYVKLAN